MPGEMNDPADNVALAVEFHLSHDLQLDPEEPDVPSRYVGSDGVRIDKLSIDFAYTDGLLEIRHDGEQTTVERKALVGEQRELAERLRAAHTGNRWAAFTDDELGSLEAADVSFDDEIRAEIERRRSDGG